MSAWVEVIACADKISVPAGHLRVCVNLPVSGTAHNSMYSRVTCSSYQSDIPVCTCTTTLVHLAAKYSVSFWYLYYVHVYVRRVYMHLMHVPICVAPLTGPRYKEVILPKSELDKANKDKKRFPSNFKVLVMIV